MEVTNSMSPLQIALLFLGMVTGGVILEVILAKFYSHSFKKQKKHNEIVRYIFLLSLPLIATGAITYITNLPVASVFLTFALVGTFLEWLVGYSYHQIVGTRLWTYHKYAIHQYTSILSVPFWGLSGVLFVLLARAFQ